MTVPFTLWRIATETRQYSADDLSGAGAAKFPGRWNEAGDRVIYTSPTRALAVLETVAHLDDAGLPLNRFLVQINVPASVWAKRATIKTLDPAWRAIPSGRYSAGIGHRWVKSGESALLIVPSIIVEEEWNVLINATHREAAGITTTVVRLFEYNRLLK